MIKTLVYQTSDKKVAVALVRGDHEVNMEKFTKFFPGQHIELADEATIVNLTGAAVGFAGPVGICDKADKVIIDHAVAAMALGATGANKTDYHTVNVVPGRDFPLEGANITVTDIRNASEGDTYEGKKLLFKRGIEVGQVFKLGTKYSAKLDAKFSDVDGSIKPCLMGCYGIGVNRIIASSVELYNDPDGMILPITIAPWEVIITTAAVSEMCQYRRKIYKLQKGRGFIRRRDSAPRNQNRDLLVSINICILKNLSEEGRIKPAGK
jgi:prolyl-tRNA synthetase